MTSLNTPHPEFYYNNMNEYIQDKYAELDKDPTITGKRKEFIKDQNQKLNGNSNNIRTVSANPLPTRL